MFFPGHFELLIICLIGLFFCLGPVIAIAVVLWVTRPNAKKE